MTLKNLTRSIALILLSAPAISLAQVTVSVNIAPPELPVYEQPAIPGEGYVWTPGYWAYSDEEQDYYWVPGTWVEAPEPGLLWTPGYWAFANGAYLWNGGYWGPHVGFYGGVNYGFGYTGSGYQGGYWRDNHMYYNRSVVNVGSTHITNVYNKTVINNVTVNRVSYNGGNGGLRSRPSASDEQAAHDRHVEFTSAQREHVDAARKDTALRASENHGRPAVAATAQPGHFTGNNVVAATRAGTVHPNPQQHGNPATPGAGPRVPDARSETDSRRDLDQRQQGSRAAREGENRSNVAPQPHVQEARPQAAPRPAPAPHPVQQQVQREAPREAPRPAAPAVEPRHEQVHTAPPRPNAPEPRPQAAPSHPAPPPRPQERAPEHH